MKMLDDALNSIQDRYGDSFKNAGIVARCHWQSLMEKLDQINDSIRLQEERDVDVAFRLFIGDVAAGASSPMQRVPKNQDWVIDYCVYGGSGAGVLAYNADGTLVSHSAISLGIQKQDMLGLVIFGGSEFSLSASAATATGIVLQVKRYMKPAKPKPSHAGEQTIGGVDPRNNPGAVDTGRHVGPATQVGMSTPIR